MGTISVKVPDELEFELKKFTKEEVNLAVADVLRNKISEKLMFKVADELLKNSKMTDELALKFGSELKKKAANKHHS